MGRKSKRVANLIALGLGVLYVIAGQAHFTDQLTPGLAQQVEIMTHNSERAMNFMNWPYPTFKSTLGYFDLLGAGLLLLPPTRRLGLWTAVFGFGGGLYGQLYTGGEVGQVAIMLGLAVTGAFLGA